MKFGPVSIGVCLSLTVTAIGLILFAATESKSSSTKYKIGDCVDLIAFKTDGDKMLSRGKLLGQFQIVGISTSIKNEYMHERFNASKHYVLRDLDIQEQNKLKGTFIIPVDDLDKFRYADVFWYHEGTRDGVTCNSYSKD